MRLIDVDKLYDELNNRGVPTNQLINNIITSQPIVQSWIPVREKMPEEHETVFARFKGTERWSNAMFEKCSDKVPVTVEFEDGTRKVMFMGTLDGKWEDRLSSVNKKVIAWMPQPEPYKGDEK